MFTQTELREALEHSATRADDLDVRVEEATPSRRWLLPVAAAAAVAVLAVGVALTGGSADTSPAPIGAAPPPARVDLVDRAVAGVDAEYSFKDTAVRASGGQSVSRELGPKGTDGTAVLTVLPAGMLDRDRVQRGQQVAIAGTTGWFAQRSWFELDGQLGAAPGRDDPLPQWTVAFRTPDGDWAFAKISMPVPSTRHDGAYDTTVKDPARIVAAYDGLRIRFVRDTATQPLRFATVPDGTRLTSAGYTRKDGRVTDESLTFTRGSEHFTVRWSLLSQGMSTGGCETVGKLTSSAHMCFLASRVAAGGLLSIVGTGKVPAHHDADTSPYARSQQRVLDGITVATDPSDYVSFEQAVTP